MGFITRQSITQVGILGAVSTILPKLRLNLDFMPSPVEDRPGLLIRDPYQFSDVTIIVPPALVACLECFDGEQTELDLRQQLVRSTGELDVGDLQTHLTHTLSTAGFLEDENFDRMRDGRTHAFVDSPRREAAHAGSGYPESATELRAVLDNYMSGSRHVPPPKVLGIAAPHVSPFGGWESYQAAYSALTPTDADRTFVVLGTSHYGEPDRFGLTRKPFRTPYGDAPTDTLLVDELAAQANGSVMMEDYCHAVEHSIEFQVVFLQHLYGPNVKIVPILCGSFARSIYVGGMPEDHAPVARFLDTLGNVAAREGDKLCWVLGIDMAHMGARYGDRFSALADQAEMLAVAARDKNRIESINAGDVQGFWDQVRDNHDDLKWCGSAPMYTFLRAVPSARGNLRKYQQWNIDEQSVVSFAGMTFSG
jgi:AmmeMemoRadiSam system protein B